MSILRRYKRFDEVLPSFLAEKEVQVGRKSYLSYTRKSDVFYEWLQEQGLDDKPMRKITEQHIADFFIAIAPRFDRPTCQKFFLALRSIFKYAKKKGEVKILPFDKEMIVFPRKGKDCSAALIPSHILPILLNDIKEHDSQLFLACMMEFYCATRPGKELRFLKVRNFDLTDGVVTVEAANAKNGKTGRINMSDDLIQICRDYGIEGADPELCVFGKNKHMDTIPLSENMLRYRFNKYRDKYGLSHDVKLYSFKHIGASYLIHSKIIDILELKEHLRHANLGATQHYVKKVLGDRNNAIKTQFPNPLKKVI
jgi:site-specific recombinase XerD